MGEHVSALAAVFGQAWAIEVHGAGWETAREHGTVVHGAGRGVWTVEWAADGEELDAKAEQLQWEPRGPDAADTGAAAPPNNREPYGYDPGPCLVGFLA